MSSAAAPALARSPVAGPTLTRGRVAALDGLRGLAVLLVVVEHYYVVVPGPDGSGLHRWLQHAASLSFCGVDLFFVLSGFLIGGILFDHRDSPKLLPAFYARRSFRILPLYFVLLASYFICREIPGLSRVNYGLYFTSSVPDWSYLCFGQNIAMAVKRDIGAYWLGATWSLAVEEQFYLLAPFAILRLSRRQILAGSLLLIAMSPLLRTVALRYAQNNLAAVFLLPMHADGLLWGVLCAMTVRSETAVTWLRQHRGKFARLCAVLAAGTLALGAGGFAPDSPQMTLFGYSLLGAFFAIVLLQLSLLPEGLLPRLLSVRPLVAVGLTSYFIYLFHTPIWYVLHWAFLGRPPMHVTWMAGAITCLAAGSTLLFSWASWRWFEAPLLRIGHKFSYR